MYEHQTAVMSQETDKIYLYLNFRYLAIAILVLFKDDFLFFEKVTMSFSSFLLNNFCSSYTSLLSLAHFFIRNYVSVIYILKYINYCTAFRSTNIYHKAFVKSG